jgi:glutamine amidotransferase
VYAAERIVLPGQGAMPDCMRELRDSGPAGGGAAARGAQAADGRVRRHADAARRSEERPTDGLGLIPARCALPLEGRLQPDGSRYKVPQMGWNRVIQARRTRSGRACPTAPTSTSCTASTRGRRRAPQRGETEYGERFTCALARDNIFATQFHPEKSATTASRCTATSSLEP